VAISPLSLQTNYQTGGVFTSADKIMKQESNVEQVCAIENIKGSTCTFKMAGGEFCGNACRAVAEFMRKNYGFGKSKIIINGIEVQATSNGETSQIIIAKKDLVKEITPVQCVFMNGITHIIIPEEVGDALGVMFVKENKINPFVLVPKAKTFFNETACLSGSIATALVLGGTKIAQPTNETYSIEIDETEIKARGKVAFLYEKKITMLV